MKIAILDDEQIYQELIRQEVCTVFRNMECIRQYADSKALLDDLANGESFELYFLDVEMPGLDGLSVARNIRRQDAAAHIIFITAFAICKFKIKSRDYETLAYKNPFGHCFLPVNIAKCKAGSYCNAPACQIHICRSNVRVTDNTPLVR